MSLLPIKGNASVPGGVAYAAISASTILGIFPSGEYAARCLYEDAYGTLEEGEVAKYLADLLALKESHGRIILRIHGHNNLSLFNKKLDRPFKADLEAAKLMKADRRGERGRRIGVPRAQT